MKPRVIILSTFLSPFRSGAEACAEEVALRLAEKFDITIVTAKLKRSLPRRDMLRGKVPVRRVGIGCGFDKWLFPFLAPLAAWKVVKSASSPSGVICHAEPFGELRVNANEAHATPLSAQHDIVILHAILETFAGLALHFCRWTLPSVKRVLTLQTLNRSFLKGPIVRSPHAVTAISAALKERAETLGRKDVTVIPNGIPLAIIQASQKRMQRVPGRVLFVGRLERMKGVDTLLRAFAELLKVEWKGSDSSVHLRIVGDGSEHGSLEALAAKLAIADLVQFVGFIPSNRIHDEFAQAEIFCGLSRSEALGNVFIEAQAAGCAVVATRVGGIPEIVQDGVTGLLVPPDDVAVARSALGKLLRDIRLRHTLAERGRANAEKYDWGVIAERYREVYSTLLS